MRFFSINAGGCSSLSSAPGACEHPRSTHDAILTVIEKVSAVALGIFALSVSSELFIPFFLLGILLGMERYVQDETACGHAHSAPSCAHGLLEQFTGVKLPRIVSVASDVALTVCHIDHHTTFVVPFVGLSLGAWAGKSSMYYGNLMQKTIRPLT